jgi:predicted GNAT family acetyltransferase
VDKMSEDTQVRDNPEASRYEILVGDTVAGFTEYTVHGRQLDLTHTEVGSKFEGRGLASQLIGELLDDVRRRGLEVMPYCPFVRKFVAKHDEYLDLVPAEHRARFGLAA